MAKRLAALAILVSVAGFVSIEGSRVGPDASTPATPTSRLVQLAMGGAVIVLSPIGSMVGCGGGGGPKPTSATAVAMAEAVVDMGSADAPVMATSGTAGVSSRLEIGDRRPVTDVSVSVRLSRPAAGDVRLALRHPDGAEVVLFEGRTAGFARTLDSTSRPELRSLAARSAQGTWSLAVTSRDGDATLESWSLRLRVRE
jgi:subtilisin-like proprotein convertase family protein